MGLVNRLIRVTVGPDRQPLSFWWNRRRFRINEVIEVWRDTGQWWEGEAEKSFYRVSAGRGVYELCFDSRNSEWRLYKVYD